VCVCVCVCVFFWGGGTLVSTVILDKSKASQGLCEKKKFVKCVGEACH
jgi:hypothetical protein